MHTLHSAFYLVTFAGNAKLDSGDYAEAVKLYTKAIEIDGSNATFFANR